MPKDNNTLGPLPQDGEEYQEELELGLPEEDEDTPPAKVVEDPRDAELRRLRETVDGLQSSIAALRNPQPAPKPAEREPEPDWEDLMFKDPKKYNELLRKSVKDEISADLRNEYQRDQGSRDFWSAFYKDHEDLKGDDDIVKAILQANLAELAPMPVKAAGDKLAELTRERILRYSGGKVRSGKKAVAEGQGQPTPKKTPPPASTVVTLSSLIKARREKRMNKGTAA